MRVASALTVAAVALVNMALIERDSHAQAQPYEYKVNYTYYAQQKANYCARHRPG